MWNICLFWNIFGGVGLSFTYFGGPGSSLSKEDKGSKFGVAAERKWVGEGSGALESFFQAWLCALGSGWFRN